MCQTAAQRLFLPCLMSNVIVMLQCVSSACASMLHLMYLMSVAVTAHK
jgi:hypothetical protein